MLHCRCRWYLVLALAVVSSSSTANVDRHSRATTMDVCQRDPPDIHVDSMPGDHGFRVHILGHTLRYTAGQVYTGRWTRRVVNSL